MMDSRAPSFNRSFQEQLCQIQKRSTRHRQPHSYRRAIPTPRRTGSSFPADRINTCITQNWNSSDCDRTAGTLPLSGTWQSPDTASSTEGSDVRFAVPRVPMQTGKKQFVDSLGNTQDVTTHSLLGPLSAPPANVTARPEPVRFHHTDNRGRMPAVKQPSGYIGSPVDDQEWLAKHWGH